MKSVNTNIKFLRRKKGMSQDELAEKTHVTRQTISNYETGKTNPDIEMLMLMAEIFEVDMNYLVTDSRKEVTNRTNWFRIIFWVLIWGAVSVLLIKTLDYAREYANTRFYVSPYVVMKYLLRPGLSCLFGWFLVRVLKLFAINKIEENNILKFVSWFVFLLFAIYFFVALWYTADIVWTEINKFQTMKKHSSFNSSDVLHFVPGFIGQIFGRYCMKLVNYNFIYICFGIVLGNYKNIRKKTM